MAFRIPLSAQRHMVDAGIVPVGCTSVELLIPAQGPMALRYQVHVTPELLERIGVVFTAAAAELLADKERTP